MLSNFGHLDKVEKLPREIVNPNVQKDILWMEKQEGSMNFKFGIIYAKAGQIMDDELFSNETGKIMNNLNFSRINLFLTFAFYMKWIHAAISVSSIISFGA